MSFFIDIYNLLLRLHAGGNPSLCCMIGLQFILTTNRLLNVFTT